MVSASMVLEVVSALAASGLVGDKDPPTSRVARREVSRRDMASTCGCRVWGLEVSRREMASTCVQGRDGGGKGKRHQRCESQAKEQGRGVEASIGVLQCKPEPFAFNA